MSNKRNKHESENEDDPEPFESSGDEWDAQESKNGRRKSARVVKKPKRVAEESGSDDFEDKGDISDEEFFEEPKNKKSGPKSTKTAKKQQVKDSEEAEDSSDGEIVEDEQPKKKKPAPKKAAAKPTPKKKKATVESEEAEDSSEEDDSGSDNEDSSSSSKSRTRQPLPKTIYSEDFATGSFVILKKDAKGGAAKHPVIWRIDGKALLQKFEAFDEGDKIRHRNTSIYTGWSPLDQELYGPLTVDVISHYKSSLIVEVHWNELSAINADSD